MDSETVWARGRFVCPECGSEMSVRRLKAEDEAGQEWVLFFDCPTDDYRVAATEKDLVSAASRVVMEGLRREIGGAALP